MKLSDRKALLVELREIRLALGENRLILQALLRHQPVSESRQEQERSRSIFDPEATKLLRALVWLREVPDE